MEITEKSIINDVVKQHPQTLAVFTKYKIDACCGSYDSIEIGVKKVGSDINVLISELSELIKNE